LSVTTSLVGELLPETLRRASDDFPEGWAMIAVVSVRMSVRGGARDEGVVVRQ
jgi:hypothetical protein